jgi:hypothetical protein
LHVSSSTTDKRSLEVTEHMRMDRKQLPLFIGIISATVGLSSIRHHRDRQARDASMEICKAKARELNDGRAVRFGTYRAKYVGDKNYRLFWDNATLENSRGEMMKAPIVCRVREHSIDGLRASIEFDY